MSVLDTMGNEAILAAVKKFGGQRGAARALKVPRTSFQNRVYEAQRAVQSAAGASAAYRVVPDKAATSVYIFTSAQDQTKVHMPFWNALKAYARHRNAEIMVSGFTYQKGLFEDHSKEAGIYASEIAPFLTNKRIEIAGKVAFCGEMNTLPTAVRPLSGLKTYTRDLWGIFPHPKVQLESVPTLKYSPPKMNLTTGCVTESNYVPKKAGLKAEFHHIIGAVVCEFAANGEFFIRHIKADETGGFQDLTTYVKPTGEIEENVRVEAVNWGDIHVEKLCPVSALSCWGLPVKPDDEIGTLPKFGSLLQGGSMLDVLMPRFQFFHDTSDFTPRNHHNIGDPHFRFEQYMKGTESVEDAMYKCAKFLVMTYREWCDSVVVESNHDLALLKWLKHSDYRTDPVNALFFLKCQKRIYQAIYDQEENFSIFEWVMKELLSATGKATFLREDDSFTICGNERTGIQCALHGHLGANGSRGGANILSVIGPRGNFGHVHSPYILDGAMAAGVRGSLDMGYNKGPSGWAACDIVTYPNGNRALIFMAPSGAWRAV